MPYEVEFLPVGDGRSGDAIAIRYAVSNGYEVAIVDGGTEASGNALVEHVRQVYRTTSVRHVICTHPDNDHACGLRQILGALDVGELWIHIPWAHAQRTRHMFGNNNWTDQRLQDAIRRNYPIIEELYQSARAKNVQVSFPFQGAAIGPFVVAAPSLARYDCLLPQFRDTPVPDEPLLRRLGEWITGIGRRTTRAIRKTVQEDLHVETLREGGTTSAENESSVVLYGEFPTDSNSVLLTGDAGLLALNEALAYLEEQGYNLRRLGMVQVPHHGSRNNIAPSILNRLLGQPLTNGAARRPLSAIVSASLPDKDHPRQIVVNAFDRRGVTVYPTHGGIVRHHRKMPPRAGWGPASSISFSAYVEEYD